MRDQLCFGSNHYRELSADTEDERPVKRQQVNQPISVSQCGAGSAAASSSTNSTFTLHIQDNDGDTIIGLEQIHGAYRVTGVCAEEAADRLNTATSIRLVQRGAPSRRQPADHDGTDNAVVEDHGGRDIFTVTNLLPWKQGVHENVPVMLNDVSGLQIGIFLTRAHKQKSNGAVVDARGIQVVPQSTLVLTKGMDNDSHWIVTGPDGQSIGRLLDDGTTVLDGDVVVGTRDVDSISSPEQKLPRVARSFDTDELAVIVFPKEAELNFFTTTHQGRPHKLGPVVRSPDNSKMYQCDGIVAENLLLFMETRGNTVTLDGMTFRFPSTTDLIEKHHTVVRIGDIHMDFESNHINDFGLRITVDAFRHMNWAKLQREHRAKLQHEHRAKQST